MNNLYILANLLPTYHHSLQTIGRLQQVCRDLNVYQILLQKIKNSAITYRDYYCKNIIPELQNTNEEIYTILTNQRKSDGNICYYRNKRTVYYIRKKNKLSAYTIYSGVLIRKVYLCELCNYTEIET